MQIDYCSRNKFFHVVKLPSVDKNIFPRVWLSLKRGMKYLLTKVSLNVLQRLHFSWRLHNDLYLHNLYHASNPAARGHCGRVSHLRITYHFINLPSQDEYSQHGTTLTFD